MLVSCSSPLRDKYFCRKLRKFAFPNFVKHRFPQHGLLVSNAIWRFEHRKLYLLRLTWRGILRKTIGLLTQTPSEDESTLSLAETSALWWISPELNSSIEMKEAWLLPASDFDSSCGDIWFTPWLYSSIENKELLDNVYGSIENKEFFEDVDKNT